ncbi:MAG: hypothetical protein R3B40_04335 [Polyangiales bacterium]|nr:hypothetical protein [Sandaracinaceae bacterium]
MRTVPLTFHTSSGLLIASLLTALGLLVSVPVARAQPASEPTEEQIEAARQLFAEGLALSDASEWQAAAAVFHEVLAVVSSPPVLFNLAHALVELNQFDEADELIERMLADGETDRDLRSRARDLRTRMDRNGGRLTLTDGGLPANSSILLDGRPLDASRVGQALRVSQGTHRVTATDQAGAEISASEVYIARRARQSVVVTADQALIARNAEQAAAAAQAEAAARAEAAAARAAADAELAELQRQHAQWEADRAAGRVPDGENPFEVRRAELERQRALDLEEHRRAQEAAEHAPREDVPLRRDWRLWLVVGSVAALAIGVGAAVAATHESTPNRGALGNFSPGRIEF